MLNGAYIYVSITTDKPYQCNIFQVPGQTRTDPRTHTHTQHTCISSVHKRISSVGGYNNGKSMNGCRARLCGCTTVEQKIKKKVEMRVFHRPVWLWLSGTRPRDYLPDRATLNAQSTRHGTWPGLNLRLAYTRVPCCVPRSRERKERPADGRQTIADVQNKCIRYIYTQGGEWGGPRGVTQAGMPQEKVANRHTAVVLVVQGPQQQAVLVHVEPSSIRDTVAQQYSKQQ